MFCLETPNDELDWFPSIDHEIKCVDKDKEEEPCVNCNICTDISDTVEIHVNVIYECSTHQCLFDCKFADEEVNIEQGESICLNQLFINY